MGCWNGTCAVTELHVTAGQRVAVFMLEKQERAEDFCYNYTYYRPCLLPFYGEYNDYGAVENCSGIGLPVVLKAIQQRLTELDQGPNPYHDPSASREKFDIDALFDLDHEGRLFIDGKSDAAWLKNWMKERMEEGDDVAAAKYMADFQEKVDMGKRITHVIVHGDVFDHIINTWMQEDYVSDKTHKDGYYYKKYGFQDILADMPQYLEKLREISKPDPEEDGANAELQRALRSLRRMNMRDGIFEWDHPNLVNKWLRVQSLSTSLIDHNDLIAAAAADDKTDEQLVELITDILKGCYINAFMSMTRKTWMKPTGCGSQNSDLDGYEVLVGAYQKVITAERAERAEWDREEEDFIDGVDDDADVQVAEALLPKD